MPYADPLTDDEIEAALAGLDDWAREADTIRRTVVCADFRAAISLVNAVADAAEAADHHPDIELRRYKRVTFTLTTHAAKAITRRDIELATEINRLAARIGAA
jgi:4a-hydroxytetrahydrobiopterin dehydratase